LVTETFQSFVSVVLKLTVTVFLAYIFRHSGEFLYNCETNDRNVSVTKMSQQKWPKCFIEKKQGWNNTKLGKYLLHCARKSDLTLTKLTWS